MKPKITTGMLFICAALLGAFIWFIERDSGNTAQNEMLSRKIFAAYPAEIDWVRMTRDNTDIECSRIAGTWRMTRPVDAPVNNAVVEQMIAGMAGVERGELITEATIKERGLTPADYGFDAPRATITFRNNRGTSTWLIGRDAPLGESLYVMAADSRDIIAAPKTLLNLIPKDPAWIRDRTLFSNSAVSVHGIDLRRTGGIIQLRQDDDSRWILQQPFAGAADPLQVNKLIEHAFAANIRDFITDTSSDLTAYGLEEPAIELSLFEPDDHVTTLLIGKLLAEKPEEQYAKWADSPAVFTVASEWVAGFELDSTLLRSRRVLDEQLMHISKISISSEAEQIELLRTNSLWQVTRPARWDAEPDAIQTLLGHLSAGMIAEFIDTPDAELTAKLNTSRWIVKLTTGTRTQTIRFTPGNGHMIVRRNDETACGRTGSEIFNADFADPLFYRSRTLLQINPQQIKSIELKTEAGELRVEKSEGKFTSTDRTRTPNEDALTDLTAELVRLRSDRLVAFNPESLEPYGLENPQARLTVTLTATNTIGQVLLFGKPVEGGRYAMLRGQPVIFILPEKTANTLTRELTQSVEKQTTETAQP